ncbi:MAG: hypothetical protein PHH16_04420 [Candidatus Gracilibacteria bacterium]|nr:hypothetical protein [Candidatus Gracilibacteria bacterium]
MALIKDFFVYLKDLLQVILVWPFAAILTIFFLKESIQNFLNNIVKFKIGSNEFQLQGKEGSIISDVQTKAIESFAQDELKEEKSKANNQDLIDKLTRESIENEFRYLNILTVPRTKTILKWISGLGNMTKDAFMEHSHTLFGTEILRSELVAIHSILLGNGLISEQNNQLSITEKGKAFLSYIGM